ncbi:hypothetical protein D1641_11015 [Colidextribacter sp. OB.20]|uniref:hypothetical protein n=1 Tax=Colidextribacter sp. OB.20 TaxID=2304568 RepID=UPI00136E79A7|nr:hypothetical protein [Colidextribacter sp. OB.20]NBI10538.1 hypothetical protein [Colidextribacter sp. OB.20]
MNTTPNYQLSQWEAEDRVLRTDFNADNAKIEAALCGLEERVTVLERAGRNLTYYVGLLGLLDFGSSGKRLPQQSYFCDNFAAPAVYTITGDAVVANRALTLTGAGKTASASTIRLAMDERDWKTALCWVHSDVPGVTVDLNGFPMQKADETFAHMPTHDGSVFEQLFRLDRPGKDNSAQITLRLSTGTRNSLSVYDIFAFFQ